MLHTQQPLSEFQSTELSKNTASHTRPLRRSQSGKQHCITTSLKSSLNFLRDFRYCPYLPCLQLGLWLSMSFLNDFLLSPFCRVTFGNCNNASCDLNHHIHLINVKSTSNKLYRHTTRESLLLPLNTSWCTTP